MVRICQLSELEADKPRCFRVEEQDIFVVLWDGQVYAMENRCGHMSAALHKGEFTDGLVVCNLHGAGFRVEDGGIEWDAIIPPPISEYTESDNPRIQMFGELIEGVETRPVRSFPVTIQGDDVFVTLKSDPVKSE